MPISRYDITPSILNHFTNPYMLRLLKTIKQFAIVLLTGEISLILCIFGNDKFMP